MSRPDFMFCICPDSYMLKVRLDTLIAAHPSPDGSTWQRHVFWGDDGLIPAFWEHLTLQSLFSTPKALILRNTQSLPAETLRKLSQSIGQKNSAVWLFLCLEVAFEKGKPKLPAHLLKLPCYTIAEQRHWIDTTPGLTPQNFSQFITREALQHGLALQPSEVSRLQQALPLEAQTASAEIAKLALTATADGKLTPASFSCLNFTPEITLFDLIRIVQLGKNSVSVWKHILEEKLGGESSVFACIALLLREARILWQILLGTPPYLSPQVAMQKKITAQALGLPGIARLWDITLVAEKGIKSGERSPEQAFELLAAELFTLFKSTPDI